MSTVISKYAYQATWDATQLTKGLMNSRALFAQQKKIVEDSRTPFDRLAIGQENLNKLIEKFPELAKERLRIEKQLEKQYLMEESAIRKLDSAERARLRSLMTADEKEAAIAARREKRAQKLARMGDRIRSSSSPSEMGASDRERMIGGMSSGPNWGGQAESSAPGGGLSIASLTKAGVAAGIAYKGFEIVTSSLYDLAANGIEANRAMERIEITFEHFSGSADTAASMIARLREMSAESGVSFKALSEGTSRFMSQGFEGNNAIKTMAQISEITGGIPERMDRLSYTFAQIRSKQQLYAEELQQLNEAGFSPLVEIAQVLGVEMSQVRKEIESGNVTWDVFAKAIDKATSAGGRFDGFLEKFKGTSTGAANAAAAAWEKAYADVGNSMEPVSKMWSAFSADMAKQISAAAEMNSQSKVGVLGAIIPALGAYRLLTAGPDAVEEQAQIDPKAEARKKAEQERAQRLADARKREQDALKEIAARETEQNNVAMSGMQDQQFDLIKKLVPDEELAKFERTYALLSDYNKERAKTEALENFRSGYGLGDFTSKLSKEAKLEFEKTEALREQTEQLEAQKKLKAEGEQIASRYMSDEQKLSNAFLDLEKARQFGGLSQGDYDREARKLVATDTGTRELSPIMSENSEASYKFFANLQNQSQRSKKDYEKVTLDVQQKQLAAQNKLVELAKDPPVKAVG
jgi:tape measure domain-containing protein